MSWTFLIYSCPREIQKHMCHNDSTKSKPYQNTILLMNSITSTGMKIMLKQYRSSPTVKTSRLLVGEH